MGSTALGVAASEGAKPLLEIVEYTDPYCTWCWGSEPVLRKIQWVYGGQVGITYKMGGLVEDIGKFYDPANRIGGELWYLQVASHWEEASRVHGMPVDTRVFLEIKDDFRSTYPANIAVKAAEMQDEGLAKVYLRRLREGAAAERKHIHRIEVQLQLASEVGLDAQRMARDIENGSARREFLKDLRECRSMGITGFPTFLIRNVKSGRSRLITGYRRYRDFEGLVEELAGRSLRKRTIAKDRQEVLSFVKRWGRVATQEVATLLDIDRADAHSILEALVDEGLLARQRAGNDYFWVSRAAPTCSVESGVCSTL